MADITVHISSSWIEPSPVRIYFSGNLIATGTADEWGVEQRGGVSYNCWTSPAIPYQWNGTDGVHVSVGVAVGEKGYPGASVQVSSGGSYTVYIEM
jgi:hypothetical protein